MIALTQVMPYEGDFKPGTRGYMSCTPRDAPGYKAGAVTFVFVNTHVDNSSILMYQQSRFEFSSDLQLAASPWGPTPPPFPQLPRVEFVMTAADDKFGVLSRDVKVNGHVLSTGV